MLKCIAVADLCVGMYIHEFCGAWMDHPFWKSRFLLKSEKDLQRIRASSIGELWIDVSKGLDVAEGTPSVSPEDVAAAAEASLLAAVQSRPVSQGVAMEDELQRAVKLCATAKAAVVSMFGDARMGQALQFEQAGELVEEISDSVLRHPNALISLARLKNADEYTYMHSVAVCALMIALARQLGLNEALVREAGLAGLLHDIGKISVPSEILSKSGKISPVEYELIKGHAQAGHDVLKGVKFLWPVAEVALQHHERVDGTGYPQGLRGDQI
jgi:putative nucleotidyltransferase with HDIG domain